MAIDSNSLTLSEYAVMSNDPLVKKVTFSLLEQGNVLADIPLASRRTMIAQGVRWVDNLPTVNWAPLNTEPTVTKGKPTPFTESAYLIRNAIDVDAKLVEDENNITDPRGIQIEAYLRGVTYDLNDKFINNGHVTGDVNAPVGVRYRLDNTTAFGTLSEMKIDAGGVDLSQSGITSATANNFIEFVDQLLSFMGTDDGDGVVLYMNDLMKRRFARAIRALGAAAGFTTQQDAFDRKVEMYRNAVVRDIGRKADQTTRIITSTETAAGVNGSSNYTSIYGVRYGDNYFTGWQYEPLKPRDLGLLNNGVIYRTVFDWAFGLYQVHTRALGRIFDIKVS